MSDLKEIQKPIKDSLDEFALFFRQSMICELPFVNEMINFITKNSGKQIRPTLSFLSAALHGPINQNTYVSAALIELTHTASLVHDDIVDEAFQRRGTWSLNALWRSKQSVLLGDYILARGMRLAVQNKLYEIIDTMADVVEQMSKGELMQAEASRRLNVSRDSYFEIISYKTAILLASASASGARSVGASLSQISTMWQYGAKLGIAFQIKDDILDYSKTSIIGKPSSIDIKEKKMTLPLIEALLTVSDKEQESILDKLRSVDSHPEYIGEIRDFVISHGGLESAERAMTSTKEEALSLLSEYEDSPYKHSLIEFANYILKRNK